MIPRVKLRAYSPNLTAADYRRELGIAANVAGHTVNPPGGSQVSCWGYLRVDLVKPDGTQETILSGSKLGEGCAQAAVIVESMVD